MRRVLTHGLALLLTLGITGQAGQAIAESNPANVIYAGSEQKANRGPCDQDRYDVKPAMGTETVHRKVKGLIRCLVSRWSVEGGPPKAICVAGEESGWWPWAGNGSSKGLYQQVDTYWPDRATRWLRAEWFWQLRDRDPATFPNILNARANTIVSIRMAHAVGWDEHWRATEGSC